MEAMTAPLRSLFRTAAALAAAALCAGCPETLQQQCPAGATSAGGLTLNFASFDGGNSCRVILAPDGGPIDAPISSLPPTSATICSSPADGGLVYLSASGHDVRGSPLDDAGTYTFSAAALAIANTQCNCPVDISETFTGTLQGKDGGLVTFDPDGRLAPVGGLVGTLVDSVSATDAGGLDAGICRCNLPCTLSYNLTGKPL